MLTLTCYYLTLDTWHLISDTGIWHVYAWPLILYTWYLTLVLDLLYLTPDTWHGTSLYELIYDVDIDMLLLDTWYLALDIWHRYLTCICLTLDTSHLISDTGTCHVILDTWYLTLDIWHRYLTCYHLTPDTWHLIYDTWRLTCYHLLDLCYHLVLVHIWPDIVTPDWILLRLTPVLHDIFMTITFTGTWHDCYTTTRPLVLLNSCTPEFLYPPYSCPLHCYSC